MLHPCHREKATTKNYISIILKVCTKSPPDTYNIIHKVGKVRTVKGIKKSEKNTPQSISDDMTCYVTVSTDSESGICLRLKWNWYLHSQMLYSCFLMNDSRGF